MSSLEKDNLEIYTSLIIFSLIFTRYFIFCDKTLLLHILSWGSNQNCLSFDYRAKTASGSLKFNFFSFDFLFSNCYSSFKIILLSEKRILKDFLRKLSHIIFPKLKKLFGLDNKTIGCYPANKNFLMSNKFWFGQQRFAKITKLVYLKQSKCGWDLRTAWLSPTKYFSQCFFETRRLKIEKNQRRIASV